MDLSIRSMNNDDIPFVYRVFEQNRAALHENHISLDEWTECLADADTSGGGYPYESHHIVMAGAAPAAWLKIHGWDKPEICISMLVVEDAFKHKGVGRFAISFTEKQARYWAKSAVRIQTTKDNVIATECYLKCGYAIVRETADYKGGQEGYEFKKHIYPEALTEENLKNALSKMFGTQIIRVDFHAEQLQGGTVGDVRLVTGIAETAGAELPYEIILKVQKKWTRQHDPDSWRREYDLYSSQLGDLFTGSLRWPNCFHAEMNSSGNETQLWMEYIDATSGYDLTVEMLERAAYEAGRFQSRLHAEQPAVLRNISNLGAVEGLKNYYEYCHSNKNVFEYIRSDACDIPKHLCEMLIAVDDNADAIWRRIETLPIVLCHRDFWVTNIFYRDDEIVLIDWDTTGWGYFGEDIKQLITDTDDAGPMAENYKKCVPAYFKGFSEYVDISSINMDCIYEMILVCSGYSIAGACMEAGSPDDKTLCLNKLQKIYEMKNIY